MATFSPTMLAYKKGMRNLRAGKEELRNLRLQEFVGESLAGARVHNIEKVRRNCGLARPLSTDVCHQSRNHLMVTPGGCLACPHILHSHQRV
jgi:hypothetical protein